MKKRGPNFNRFILNCGKSASTETDWSFEDAIVTQSEGEDVISQPLSIATGRLTDPVPPSVDLREPWWEVRDQGRTGACVGFATADGLLRWQYVKKGKMLESERPSPRFIWMANKETDDLTRYPTTFIESAGTSTKLALGVAQKYGCVPEHMLPMNGSLTKLSVNVFFSIAAQFRITAYYNLQTDQNAWKSWISNVGPVLTRLDVDETWKKANQLGGYLTKYVKKKKRGGHAVCLVGYTEDYFIVRNSWGKNWGKKGFAYCSNEYCEKAFKDSYGAVL